MISILLLLVLVCLFNDGGFSSNGRLGGVRLASNRCQESTISLLGLCFACLHVPRGLPTVRAIGRAEELFLLLALWPGLLLSGAYGQQVKELFVRSAYIQLLLRLALRADQSRFFFAQSVHLSQQLVDFAVGFAYLVFSDAGLVLQIHLVLLVLVLVFLKRLFVGIQTLFLHDDILFQQFRLLRLVVYRDLRHQNVPGVQDEVADGLLLLPTLLEVFDGVGACPLHDASSLLYGQLRRGAGHVFIDGHERILVVAQPLERFMLQHRRVL